MKYPADMDTDCIPICDALNALHGISTFESCCGHGEHGHWIFFIAATIESLRPILECCESSAWNVEAGWANGGNRVYFWLKGPVGPANLAGGADDFASWLSEKTRERS
jgi:hypothetical protein